MPRPKAVGGPSRSGGSPVPDDHARPDPPRCLADLSPPELRALIAEAGERPFRARQLAEWLFVKNVRSYEEMTNLPARLRAKLADQVPCRSLSVADRAASGDGRTEKWLLATSDGHGVETVFIRAGPGDDGDDGDGGGRRTVCVSCSLGCPLACTFCASAEGPFIRHLSPGEIVEQVLVAREETGEDVTNVVFMGMGEPLLNLPSVLAAARALNRPSRPDDARAIGGVGLGARRVTISTAGVIPGIDRLAGEPEDFRLAVSLHAPTQKLRRAIVPSAATWPLGALMDSLRRYARAKRREVTIEYCLLAGINDSRGQAAELAELLAGLPCKINLIPRNATGSGDSGGAGPRPDPGRSRAFQGVLEQAGFRVTLRAEKGGDIAAACGQLRLRHLGGPSGPAAPGAGQG